MKQTILLVAVAFVLFGCSNGIILKPTERISGCNIAVRVAGDSIDKDVLNRLTTELKKQLIQSGYLVDSGFGKPINLKVNVLSYDPGYAAGRILIGIGPGRGLIKFNVQYEDAKTGTPLAKMAHFVPYDGWGGADSSRDFMIHVTALLIVNLASQ